MALLLIFASQAFADSRKPPLKMGMGYKDVLELWGAPEKKQELETKRQDIWLYGESKIFFTAGKVVGWFPEKAGAGDNLEVEIDEKKLQVYAQSERKDEDDIAVEDILTEIMGASQPDDKKDKSKKGSDKRRGPMWKPNKNK